MTIKLNSAKDLAAHGRSAIANIKKEVISKLSEDVSKQIQAESRNRHVAKLSYVPDGFVVGEPLNVDDPQGKKAKEIERETNAYAKAAARLASKAYVVSVIDRG